MNELINFFVAHWALSAALLTLLGFYIVFEVLHSNNNDSISPQQAVDYMNHQHAVVIDIRTKDVFGQGHIIDAINIEQSQFTDNVKKVQKYAKKTIIIVCAVGKDSPKIIAKLKKENFVKVLYITGGMHEWTTVGYPVVREKV